MGRSIIQPAETLIFLHLPKTAGTTLNRMLRKHYPPEARYHMDYPMVQQSRRELEKLPDEEKQKLRLISGHMTFGLHDALPQTATYFSMLRDPVDRVISFYYYVLRKPDNYLHDMVQNKKMSLEDFVSSGLSTEIDNAQTRLIAGIPLLKNEKGVRTELPFGQCDEAVYQQALQNIETHFSAIGFSERFDESLILFKRLFHWPHLFYFKYNVTESRPKKADLPPQTLELIERYNQWDLQLYQRCEEEFNREIGEQGDPYRHDLRFFQLLNEPYDKLCTLIRPTVRQVKSLVGLQKY